MKAQSFCYWLQGFFEIADPKNISEEQVSLIKKHLNLVFKHEIDPSMGDEKHQQELNAIHHPNKLKFPTTEEEAIAYFGAKPSPEHKFGLYGWYHPKEEGLQRC